MNGIELSTSSPGKRQLYWAEVVRRLKARQSPVEIAAEMGYHPHTIRYWIRSPAFVQFAREMDKDLHIQVDKEIQDNLQQVIEQDAPRAYAKLMEIMDLSNDEKLVADVSKDMLNRAGFMPIKKVAVGISINLAPEAIQALTSAYDESRDKRYGSKNPIDITPSITVDDGGVGAKG